jgi:hypothetical protein
MTVGSPWVTGRGHPRARGLQIALALASLASFLGSFLLFALEPFIGKILLPSFGGTPLLWNSCMVFFQIALLIGYLYALLLTRHGSVRVQFLVHLALLGSLLVLYPGADAVVSNTDEAPAWRLAAWLTRHVLFPFVILAGLTTLVQTWYARSVQDVSPYRLYAASNAGSMAGLLAYPLLLEPTLSLEGQRGAFLVIVALVVVTIAAIGVALRRTPAEHSLPVETQAAVGAAWSFDWRTVILLTAIPSSLLLGVTSYLLTDVASLPLFWVIPLVLYLTTFIVAFGTRWPHLPAWLSRWYAFSSIVVTIFLATGATSPVALLIPAHLVVFAFGSLLCHLRVASLAPPATSLPQYYLAVSAGGALGGLLTLLIPPLVTHRMIEYPAALILSTIVLAATENIEKGWSRRFSDSLLPALLVMLMSLTVRAFFAESASRWLVLAYLPAALYVLQANTRGYVFTLRLAGLFAASLMLPNAYGQALFAERTFFGRVLVTHNVVENEHLLLHGTTVHGTQRANERDRCAPTTYYHPAGPAGRFLDGLTSSPTPRRVALVGLGAGALTCYARDGERWDLFELDPVVARIATDPRFFTYLQHSKAAEKRIVLGDARIALGREPVSRYQVIIVDAFSSDAIPIHLLTREALNSYARVLAEDGMLLFHVSNRFFHLRPVLGAVAPSAGFEAFVDEDFVVNGDESVDRRYPSEWVVLAKPAQSLALGPRWRRIPAGDARVWTDGYSNPLGAMTLGGREQPRAVLSTSRSVVEQGMSASPDASTQAGRGR